MSEVKKLSSTQVVAPVKRATAPTAAAPTAMAAAAGDTFTRTPSDVRVITFNTAIGNPKITTKQEDFTKLPFYQDVITGKADAPLMCLQEVGNDQIKALEALAKNGNFEIRRQKVGLRGRQNNVILIPKRFKLESYDSTIYGIGHVKAVASKVWGFVSSLGKEKQNWSQMVEPRGYQKAVLTDTVTGKTLTMFNSHTSYEKGLREAHAKELMSAARSAEKYGPVIVGGDLNTRAADTDTTGEGAATRKEFGDYKDMGPTGSPISKTNIDWVLAKGFDSVASKWYMGDSISLPGSPNALTVSDHYAEEDLLRFN